MGFLPEVFQPIGAHYSSANDLLKYLSANMDLIHTKINDILQDTHLIRHEERTIANLTAYIGLGWDIATNLGTEMISKTGGVDGYYSVVGFNPDKHIGLVALRSCDETDALSPAPWQDFIIRYLLYGKTFGEKITLSNNVTTAKLLI
jgi:serine-type D-Ala-D-Ala carboxypeptidase/endopeptidase